MSSFRVEDTTVRMKTWMNGLDTKNCEKVNGQSNKRPKRPEATD